MWQTNRRHISIIYRSTRFLFNSSWQVTLTDANFYYISGMRPVKDTLLLQRLFEFFWRRTQFKMHLKKAIWFFGFDEFSNVLLIWLFQIGGWEEFSRKYPKISPPSYIWFWNWPFARMQTGPTKSSCPQNQLQLREIHWNILHSMPKTT